MCDNDQPALLGGPPEFPLGPDPWPPDRREYRHALLAAVGDNSWGVYHGPACERLRARLAEQFVASRSLLCASGTLAVEVALRSVGVGPGDEVILAAYEYEANLLTVLSLGAVPVLVDIDPATGNLDPTLARNAITPRTKALLASHIHGGRSPVAELVAEVHSIPVVEDAAQDPAAMTGRVATLSFGGSKLLSAGRGGAVLFRNVAEYQRAKTWLQRGLQEWAPLSELQACVLLPQLGFLAADTATRREAAAVLAAEVAEILPMIPPGGAYKTAFRFDANLWKLDREQFVRALRAEGVAFDAGFRALHVGRAPSRFCAPLPLPHAVAAHNTFVILHHPVLLGGADAARRVARAIWKTYRNADVLKDA